MTLRRRSATALAALGTAVALALPGAAQAAPSGPPPLNVDYDAVGTSRIAKTGSPVQIGPARLRASLNAADGSFTGSLPIPQTSTMFKAVGLLPVSAKIDFIEAAPVVGQLGNRTLPGETVGSQFVTSTASYTIRLSDVKVGGFPAFVGRRCQTAQPVSVPANTADGQKFNLTNGGKLGGTYTIGRFTGCGLTTGIINALVPGGGNTVEITVSNGRVVV